MTKYGLDVEAKIVRSSNFHVPLYQNNFTLKLKKNLLKLFLHAETFKVFSMHIESFHFKIIFVGITTILNFIFILQIQI